MSELRDQLITIQALTNSVKYHVNTCKGGEPITDEEFDELDRMILNIGDELQLLIDEVV